MFLLALLACGSDTCDVEVVEVADDAPLGDLPFTAADVLAATVGTVEGTVVSVDGVSSAATLTVARGEGAAVFHDATFRQRMDGDDLNPFVTEYDLQAPCNDEVDVPVSVALTVPELGIDVVVESTASPGVDFDVPESLGAVAIDGRLDTDATGLPTPPPHAHSATFQATFLDGELRHLRLSWAIQNDGRNRSEDILVFAVPGAE